MEKFPDLLDPDLKPKTTQTYSVGVEPNQAPVSKGLAQEIEQGERGGRGRGVGAGRSRGQLGLWIVFRILLMDAELERALDLHLKGWLGYRDYEHRQRHGCQQQAALRLWCQALLWHP